MHFQKLALFFTLSAIGLAQDVDDDHVPNACRAICASVIALTRSCDNTTNGDTAERQCVCTAENASTVVPLCAACITQNGESDNDVSDLVRDCSFNTTSYNPSAASTVPPATASATSTSGSGGGNAQQTTNAAPAPTMAAAVVGLGGLLGVAGIFL